MSAAACAARLMGRQLVLRRGGESRWVYRHLSGLSFFWHLPTSCHLLPPLVSTHAVHESPQVLLGIICGSAFGLQVAPLLAVLKGLFLNQVYVVSPPCSDMLAFSSAADRSVQM